MFCWKWSQDWAHSFVEIKTAYSDQVKIKFSPFRDLQITFMWLSKLIIFLVLYLKTQKKFHSSPSPFLWFLVSRTSHTLFKFESVNKESRKATTQLCLCHYSINLQCHGALHIMYSLSDYSQTLPSATDYWFMGMWEHHRESCVSPDKQLLSSNKFRCLHDKGEHL